MLFHSSIVRSLAHVLIIIIIIIIIVVFVVVVVVLCTFMLMWFYLQPRRHTSNVKRVWCIMGSADKYFGSRFVRNLKSHRLLTKSGNYITQRIRKYSQINHKTVPLLKSGDILFLNYLTICVVIGCWGRADVWKVECVVFREDVPRKILVRQPVLKLRWYL